MTLHVLHAGDGYSYLTRQVAADDRELARGEKLVDYYHAHGTPPGHWFGGGLAALGQMEHGTVLDEDKRIITGNVVSENQMQALFGEGMHPNADALISAQIGGRTKAAAVHRQSRLGRKFADYANANAVQAARTAAREAWITEHGRVPNTDEHRKLCAQADRESFTGMKGRPPSNEGELARWVTSRANSAHQPVAGFDLVFTPPKSVSTAWALGDERTRRSIERIHTENVHDALSWLEANAVFTRRGAGGTEQVDTTGLIATLYEHYDSRNGDPNLHTHAAISNKVKTAGDGRWRTIDGATLHRYAVTASQRYNARIMDQLSRELGFSLLPRSTGRGRQDVIELAEVPRELCEHFSSRRRQIEVSYDALVVEFRRTHAGRTPGPREQYGLYQQANLDTRASKQESASLSDKRDRWRVQAADFLGGQRKVSSLSRVWSRLSPTKVRTGYLSTTAMFDQSAESVLAQVENTRATWQEPHVLSAIESHLAGTVFRSHSQRDAAVTAIAKRVFDRSIPLPTPMLGEVPEALLRRDGMAVTVRHGTAAFTSTAVLDAEEQLLEAAREPSAHIGMDETVSAAITAVESDTGRKLNSGQRRLAEHFTGAGTQLAVGVGPAGTGKTTAMRAVADAWQAEGHTVIGLGPSKRAAIELGESIDADAYTLAKLTRRWRGETGPAGTLPEGISISEGTMLLVDEASLAATKDLATLTDIAASHGAIVRLLGDPAQLDAVETGGAFRLLAERTSAPMLDTVVRFGDDIEQAEASLALRTGDTAALDLYAGRGWVHHGTGTEVRDRVVEAYLADREAGASTVILASTRDDVAALNADIQAIYRRDGAVDSADSVRLSDELTAGIGDTIITRVNADHLRLTGGRGRGRRVANGDLFAVEAVGEDGSLAVRSIDSGGQIVLPAGYVAAHTELGYAATIHRAQGMTVDTAKVLAGPGMDRSALYVGLTRGRSENAVWVPLDSYVGPDTEGMHLGEIPDQPAGDADAARAVLENIVVTDTHQKSATEQLAAALEEAHDPQRLREAYQAAYARLSGDRDAYITGRIDAWLSGLPAAVAATASRSGRTQLASKLAAVYDAGGDVDMALLRGEQRIDAEWTRAIRRAEAQARAISTARGSAGGDAPIDSEWRHGLSDAADAAAALASQVTFPDAAGAPLPPLPPPTEATDTQLREFAARIRGELDIRQPAADSVAGQTATAFETYQDARDEIDRARTSAVLTTAFGESDAARLADDPVAWRVGRQARVAHAAGIDPVPVLRAVADGAAPESAATLAAAAGPMIQQQCREQRAAWLDENRDAITGALPAAAQHFDDPRWDAVAERMITRQQVTGEPAADMARQLAARAGEDASVARLDALLDTAPPVGTIGATPDWIAPPPVDARQVDPVLADRLDAHYQQLADTYAQLRAAAGERYDGESAPAWTNELGPRPSAADLARQWDTAAAEADMYRQTHQVTDTASLAGRRPEGRAAQSAYARVHQANTDQLDAQAQHARQRAREQAQRERDRLAQSNTQDQRERERTTDHAPQRSPGIDGPRRGRGLS
ncbi:MobF family relaxase [Tomitella cavernea]|uniref:MobF family relaxase n=1 Tax=Tomitella cavernea TaxID=1387982 RepID=UPI001F5B80F1|nr:MobF family relaxase [Tomitella cavernea]